MGHKVHPLGFRIGVIRDWQSKWYADKSYLEFLQEDLKLRQAIKSRYTEAGISLIEIDRQANKVLVTIHTARPGVVIGRGGQRVDEMRVYLEELIGKRVQLNIVEIQQPELDAYLVAKSVAEQLERRVAYRRAMKQASFRTIQAGAKGMRISCSGRLGGAEIARRQIMHEGQVPLHKLRADIDYGFIEAHTTMGRIGVKVWIYKGDILPEPKIEEIEEALTEAITGVSATATPPAPAEVEEKPAEPVEVSAEAEVPTPVEEEVEEKPAEPVEVSAEVEPAAPKRRRRRAEPTEVSAEAEPSAAIPEEPPAEPVEVSAEAEPAAPKRRKRRAEPTEVSAEAEPATLTENEGEDATTESG